MAYLAIILYICIFQCLLIYVVPVLNKINKQQTSSVLEEPESYCQLQLTSDQMMDTDL